MADIERLYDALRKADAAGNADDAKKLAAAIKNLHSGIDYEKLEYSPTRGMSPLQRSLAGAGQEMTGVARGAGQLVGAVSNEDVSEARSRDEPLSQTTAGKIGGVVGGVAAALPTMFIPGANTIPGAAAIGAGYGAIQQASSGGERLGNIALSSLGSGAVMGLARGVPALNRAVVSPFTKSGQDRIALDTIGRFSQDKNALGKANVDELIPGSNPTLAEVTGDPGHAQLQRAAQAASPETANAMAANKSARMAARKDALSSIAGDHDERMFLHAERASTAEQLYKQAYDRGIDIRRNPETGQFYSKQEIAGRQGEITKLLQRPAIRDAVKEARTLAANEGVKMQDFTGSVKGLDYVKRAMDSKIESAVGQQKFNEARILGDLRDRMLTTIDKLSPDYAAARQVYADMSKPINRAEVGKYLYEKLVPALSDLGAERITPAQYAKALQQGDEMAKKATGFSGARLKDVLSTEDMNLLINLGKDLGRETGATERARVPGSPTAQYLSGRNAIRQILGPLGLPEKWSESVLADTIGGRAISAIAAPSENAVQARLARFLVNPKEAQAAQARAQQQAAKMIPLSELQKRILPPISTAFGSIYSNEK